jgi:hypothetical protein
MGIEEQEISTIEEGVGTSTTAKSDGDTAFCSSASVVTITQKVVNKNNHCSSVFNIYIYSVEYFVMRFLK